MVHNLQNLDEDGLQQLLGGDLVLAQNMTAENLHQDATTASLPGSIDLPTKFSVRAQRQKFVLKKWCGSYEGLAADIFPRALAQFWRTLADQIVEH
jgi:hypothetical protein